MILPSYVIKILLVAYTVYAYLSFFTTRESYHFREVNFKTDDVMAIASVLWINYPEADQLVLGHDNTGVKFSFLNQEVSWEGNHNKIPGLYYFTRWSVD